jgi:hypothetical protein
MDDEDFRNQVFSTLSLKETDELVEIWQKNDRSEWSDTAFDVIQQILRTRIGQFPRQDAPIYEHTEQDTNEDFDDKINKIIELSEENDIRGLAKILDYDSNLKVCLEAAMALAQLDDERGIDFLIGVLKNPDMDINSIAREILVELNHPKGNFALKQSPFFQPSQALELANSNDKSMPQNKLKKDAHLSNENQLPGFPGYRTREGRSGYDSLDSSRESAFMEGSFLRKLFTFRLRTRDAFYLILMFIFGVVPFVVMLWTTAAILISDVLEYGDSGMLVMPLIFTVITGILAVNFLLSILEITKIIPPLNATNLHLSKERKDFQ